MSINKIYSPDDDYDEDDDINEDDDFQCCDNCDLPDACADFGCAVKCGLRRPDLYDFI